jgi:hypothetical protein
MARAKVRRAFEGYELPYPYLRFLNSSVRFIIEGK